MKLTEKSNALPELTKAWVKLQGFAPLRPIRNKSDFAHIRQFADMLADEVGDDEAHPLFSLFEIAMDFIERWEEKRPLEFDNDPKQVLRFLLEEHGLRQKDLADIASPTLVSDILSGRREISKNLAKALAMRFNVDVSAFV